MVSLLKKREGFTLVEVLAMLLVLIVLISVPTIISMVNKDRKAAFKTAIYGVIKSGEVYYVGQLLDYGVMKEDKVITFPIGDGLDIKGTKPTSGMIKIYTNGDVELKATKDKWCAIKERKQTDITISNNLKDCEY